MPEVMTRRNVIRTAAGLAIASAAAPLAPAAPKGRLKQSASRGNYGRIPLEDLCKAAVEIGLSGLDLISNPADWPIIQKYGLVPAMVPGAGTIQSGWNRKENHDRLEKDMRENIARAAAAKLPNVITFSGNRAGLSDAEGRDNCILGLRRVAKVAEDAGVTICMELLNSKVDHKDYQNDHTAWGVEVCKGVESPRMKLLYDIYHMQIMEGDIIRTIRANFQYLGHYHTAGNPGRKEPDDSQELQYRPIAKAIADLGFDGFIAHEFSPTRDPLTSLRQAVELCTV
jgi:hydroxypyruvate isomerase